MTRIMQQVTLGLLRMEAQRCGTDIDWDDEQEIAYLDVSPTHTMYAPFGSAR